MDDRGRTPAFVRSNLAASLGGDDPAVGAFATRLITGAPREAEVIAERVLRAVDAAAVVVLERRRRRLIAAADRMSPDHADAQAGAPVLTHRRIRLRR